MKTMPASHHSFSTGRMPLLLPNQHHQSTEGYCSSKIISSNPSLSLNSSLGTLSFTLTPDTHL